MSFGQPPPGGYNGPPGGAPPGGGGGQDWAAPPGSGGAYGGPPAGGGGQWGPPAGGGGGQWGPPPGGGGFGGPPAGGGGQWGPPPGHGQPMYSSGVPGGPAYHQQGAGATDPVAIVSLVLGLVSLPMHFCCYLGWPLGIGAIVCGIIAMSRSGDPPNYYGGKGLAIGGLAAAGFGFLMIILVLVFWGAAVMFSKP